VLKEVGNVLPFSPNLLWFNYVGGGNSYFYKVSLKYFGTFSIYISNADTLVIPLFPEFHL